VKVTENRVPALIRLRHRRVEREVFHHGVFLLRVDPVNPVERAVGDTIYVVAGSAD
jgi:class 3 adenylate cyclase